MKYRILLSLFALLLNSCAIYETDFDCPPDIGVPCTSSSDIESMVVETKSGPDIFLGKETICYEPIEYCQNNIENQRKIWICPQPTKCGHQIGGYYIYQTNQPQLQSECSAGES